MGFMLAGFGFSFNYLIWSPDLFFVLAQVLSLTAGVCDCFSFKMISEKVRRCLCCYSQQTESVSVQQCIHIIVACTLH